MNEARRRTQLDDLQRRFMNLPQIDQVDFCRWVEEYLRLERPLWEDEELKRNETLDCIRRVAAHLDVTRPPTVAEYQDAAPALGLEWSWQRIHKLWGSFAVASSVALGAIRGKSAQQRHFLSCHGGSRPKPREDYIEAVRQWLATNPPKPNQEAYDAFARERNYTLAKDELQFPRVGSIHGALSLRWRDVVAIARGELDQQEAVIQRREYRDWMHGPHQLIARSTIALMTGRHMRAADNLAAEADFPRPALIVANRRMWLREEVENYIAGERVPLKEANRLRDEYRTTEQVAAALAVTPTSVRKFEDELPRIGRVGHVALWLAADVDLYVERHCLQIERRRKIRAGISGTDRISTPFVTSAVLARDLELGAADVRLLTRKAGFPRPIASFGTANIWLRSDVEAYRRGWPVPERAELALQEQMIESRALADYLGYTTVASFASNLRSQPDFPRPAAYPGPRTVWLRDEIDAWLAGDAKQRELREKRLTRRRRRAMDVGASSG